MRTGNTCPKKKIKTDHGKLKPIVTKLLLKVKKVQKQHVHMHDIKLSIVEGEG